MQILLTKQQIRDLLNEGKSRPKKFKALLTF